MGRSKLNDSPFRMTVTLTPDQRKKMAKYLTGLMTKLGRPFSRNTPAKIVRMALDEWLEHHSEDYDIRWDKRK